MKIIVIGAGIFGISTAIKLSQEHDVTLVDTNDDIMSNASKCNHNRLHFGFHYPRSIETAKQSLDGYESFYSNFKDSIIDNFPNYYMIERGSKINSRDYSLFCNDLGLDIKEVYPSIDMDLSNIESSYLTKEPIFDYESIKLTLKKMLDISNVNIVLGKTIKDKSDVDEYDVIVNTTYSNINKIKRLFDIDDIKLRLQVVVVPIFRMDHERIGLTIMDGNYCSIMPKGFEENNFLLYHVKNSVILETEGYTPPINWSDISITKEDVDMIYEKSKEYFTFLENSTPQGYWKTIRALPINNNDCRLSDISCYESNGKKIISVLSGKITTCWDVAENIKNMI